MSELPEGFASLDRFVGAWCAPDLAARDGLRGTCTAEARQEFYEAMTPLVARALDELGGKPLDALDPAGRRLLELVLVYPHVAMTIEVQGDAEPVHVRARSYMAITPGV